MAANALTAGAAVVVGNGTGGSWPTRPTSTSQRRSTLYDAETHLLGRRLSATPNHLSRALYVPRHNHTDACHLPVYDISRRYKEAVGDTPVGSSLYIVKLGTMTPPKGDGTDDVDVAYLVDFEKRDGFADIGTGAGTGFDEAEGDGVGDVAVAEVQRVGPLRWEDDDEVVL